jgi:hypothetical protein
MAFATLVDPPEGIDGLTLPTQCGKAWQQPEEWMAPEENSPPMAIVHNRGPPHV